ncbi:MAG: YhjD/YihY/BrkB family envelope integrity protein [Pseudonocardiaceae bacterium]
MISGQLTALTESSDGALTTGLIISLLAALWDASSGTNSRIAAINVAYDELETRGFVKQRATALALTLGAVVFVLVAVALIAGVPAGTTLLGQLCWAGYSASGAEPKATLNRSHQTTTLVSPARSASGGIR